MYQISVEKDFDAAHALRGYRGKCESLHGHRFRVVVKIEAGDLNDIGIAYDFAEVKRHLGEVIASLDHTNLNELPPFDRINPSSENLASMIYQKMKSGLSKEPVSLVWVEVWESPQTGVRYIPD